MYVIHLVLILLRILALTPKITAGAHLQALESKRSGNNLLTGASLQAKHFPDMPRLDPDLKVLVIYF